MTLLYNTSWVILMNNSQEYGANWARERYNNNEEYREAKKQRNNEWSKNNREKKTATLRRLRSAKREQCVEHLGGKCCGCGVTENLQFDHIDRTQKKFHISRIIDWKFERILPELDKCQLLCKTCHTIKSRACYDHQELLKGYSLKNISEDTNTITIIYKKDC